MFDAFCPQHGRRVLLTSRRILSLTPSTDGIVVRFRCWCGHVGYELFGEPRGGGAHRAQSAA